MMKNIFLKTILGALIFITAQVGAQTTPNELLLKDYRPKSIYNVAASFIKKAKYPVTDMHSHPYAQSKEEIGQWVELMDEAGVEKTILLTGAYGSKFDSLVQVYSRYPDRFELWCGLDYTGYDQPGFGENILKELERCYRAGAKGVGELGDKGKGLFYCSPRAYGMHLDDARMDVVWEKCAELGLPVNIHLGEPQWFYEPMDATNDGLMTAFYWRLDNQEGILNLSELIKTLENAVAKHPKTTFIACHLANCNHDLEMIGRLLDKHSNLYIDISARFAESGSVPGYTARFLKKHKNRILYGTDLAFKSEMYQATFRVMESGDEHFYESSISAYHWPLYGLSLPKWLLKKIYQKNAGSLYR